MAPDAFEVFNQPAASHQVHLLRRSSYAKRDPVTHILAAESFGAPVLIKASIDRPVGLGMNKTGVSHDRHKQDGLDMEGELRMYTSFSPIDVNDRVQVTFLNGTAGRSVKTYRIRALVNDYGWLEQFTPGTTGRREWSIVLEDPPARPA